MLRRDASYARWSTLLGAKRNRLASVEPCRGAERAGPLAITAASAAMAVGLWAR